MVFGTNRSVDQIRGQFERARAHAGAARSEKQSRQMDAAQLARGTATVRVQSWEVPDNGSTCEIRDETTASGLLTSSSRLVTVHHAVPATYVKDNDGDNVIEEDNRILVSFGGKMSGDRDNLSDMEMHGTFIPDGDGNNNFYGIEDQQGDTKSNANEENALLANRLFAVGLQKWARDKDYPYGNQRRNTIRKFWPFAIDGTRSAQESDFLWENDSDGEIERLDVMVLKALSHDDITFSEDAGSEDFLISGGFPVNKPGVFFNFQNYRAQVPSCPPKETDPLYFTHFTHWPDDTSGSDNRWVPLVSNPGYTDGEYPWKRNGSEHTIKAKFCAEQEQQPVDVRYGKFIGTSIDTKAGGSGGALLAQGRFDFDMGTDEGCETNRSWDLYPVGVGTAIQHPDDPDGDGQEEDYRGDWKDPVFPDGWDDDGSEDPWDGPTDAWATIVTGATEAVHEWSDRDRDPSGNGTPWNPRPKQPANPGDQLECMEYNEEGSECLRYQTYKPSENEAWGERPWIGATKNDEASKGEQVDYATNEGLLHGLCGYYSESFNLAWDVRAGLVAGFAGGATDARLQQGTGVGNFKAICAPWSNQDYVTNWRFLRVELGRWVDPAEDAWSGYPTTTFSRFLRETYEFRFNDEIETNHIRPPSYKMCPPNYYVRSLEVIFNPKETNSRGEPTFVGLRRLECVRADSDGNVDSLWVSLNTNHTQEGSSAYDDFSFFGRSFSLDQHVGDPGIVANPFDSQTPYEETTLGCNNDGDHPNYAISGLTFDATNTGAMHDLHIECLPLPN